MASPNTNTKFANRFLTRVWGVMSALPYPEQKRLGSVVVDLAAEIAEGNLNHAAAWAVLKGIWSGDLPASPP